MKKIIIIIPALIFAFSVLQAQPTPATQLAEKIAKKMKDTLNLTGNQRNQIYNFNMQLHTQKSAARQQFTDADLLRINLQRIENTRDSLYHSVLPEPKYLIYQQKKRNLVSGN